MLITVGNAKISLTKEYMEYLYSFNKYLTQDENGHIFSWESKPKFVEDRGWVGYCRRIELIKEPPPNPDYKNSLVKMPQLKDLLDNLLEGEEKDEARKAH